MFYKVQGAVWQRGAPEIPFQGWSRREFTITQRRCEEAQSKCKCVPQPAQLTVAWAKGVIFSYFKSLFQGTSMTPSEQPTGWTWSCEGVLMFIEPIQIGNKDTNTSVQPVCMDKAAFTWPSLSLFPLHILRITSCNFFLATACSVIMHPRGILTRASRCYSNTFTTNPCIALMCDI